MKTMLLTNIKTLYGTRTGNTALVKGAEMKKVPFLNNAYLLIEGETIKHFGPMSEIPERADILIDCSERLVMPAWCDSHTHIVFASGREHEYILRLSGASYEDIARNGGGILNSAMKLQQTDEDALFDSASQRLHEIISTGTGALEIKSGYGLTLDSELKMLRVIRRLKESGPALIKATFLGAHAIPAAYKQDREAYVNLLIHDMLPRVAGEGLADYCDVFCDTGFFTIDETNRILDAAASLGLKPKIHANELANSGGVQAGISRNAVSVDHLEQIGDAEIDALLQSSTIPTVLPFCSFFLNIPFAPARRMIDAGLGLAIASDYNPGSSPSGNIPLLLSMACNHMRLLPGEAFNGATLNGACAMELEPLVGSITPGKLANLLISKPIPSLDYMVYAFGASHIDKVVLGGQLVY